MSATPRFEFIASDTVAPWFEAVAAAFDENFERRGEVGAACAVYHRGDLVVNLWRGIRDQATGAPWEADTPILVASTTKGMSAIALAVAHSRGLIDHDEFVATYWPEFAQQGKARITVRQLLAHQAGLAACSVPLTHDLIADPDALAVVLAAQKPRWEPGTRHGYHFSTLGMYESELIRRVDPDHRSLGRFFQAEVAKPLGLDFYIGLPPDFPRERLAQPIVFGAKEALFGSTNLELSLAVALPWALTRRAIFNPSIADTFADLSLEMPSGNGVGTAESIARAYSALAEGGGKLGLQSKTIDALKAPPVAPTGGDLDLVMRARMAWSLGFMRPSADFEFGSGLRSLGMPGLGGSFGYADLDSRTSYAYTPNKWRLTLFKDPRDVALRTALQDCLRRLEA